MAAHVFRELVLRRRLIILKTNNVKIFYQLALQIQMVALQVRCVRITREQKHNVKISQLLNVRMVWVLFQQQIV